MQEPTEALYPGMPASAIEHVAVDAVVPSGEIAEAIALMVNGQDLPPDPDPREGTPDLADPGQGTVICPECGAVLSERREAGMTHWECRVGHRYSPETLVDSQAEGVEAALWAAARALNDRSVLLHRMADRAQTRGQVKSARSFRRRGELADDQAELVRRTLTQAAEGSLSKITDDDGIEDSVA